MPNRYSTFCVDQSEFDASTGFLKVDATIARVGVQLYMTADGVRRELRPEIAVADSAATFKAKPLTLNHPSTNGGAVTSDNFKDVIVGIVPDIKYEDGLLKTVEPLIIQDKDAIQAATTTHQQLSAGYMVDLIEESGVWEDTFGVQGPPGAKYEYDSIQTNIRANHVALVEKGRAGEIASLKFDSDDNKFRELLKNDAGYEIDSEIEPISTVNQKIVTIMPITIDGKEYNETQVVDLFHNLKNDHQKALEASQAEIASEKERADLAEGKLLAAEKTNSELTEQIKTLNSDEDIQTEIAARMDAWMTALPILELDNADYSLSVAAVEKLVVAKLAPEMSLDGMSESTLHGLYLGLMANRSKKDDAPKADSKENKSDDGLAAFQAVLNRSTTKQTSADVINDGYASYEQELENAWKKVSAKSA